MCLVTIGLCVKNSEKTIRETLDSIVNQIFPRSDIEIIVVDGGSKDNTLEIIRDVLSMRNVPSIKIIRQTNGLGAQRQAVVDEATSQYIAWVDGDVILSKNFLEEQSHFLKKNTDVGLVGGKNEYIESSKTLVSKIQHLLFGGVETVHLGASLSRTKALKDAGGFDIRMTGANEDTDIKIRLIMAGWKVTTNPKAIFYHNEPRRSLRELYTKYAWYGYGSHFMNHKYEAFIKIPYELPIFYFGWGVKMAFKVYKQNRRKISFLIPMHCVLQSIFSCIGFLRGHLDGYGHSIKKHEFGKDVVMSVKRRLQMEHHLSSVTSAEK